MNYEVSADTIKDMTIIARQTGAVSNPALFNTAQPEVGHNGPSAPGPSFGLK